MYIVEVENVITKEKSYYKAPNLHLANFFALKKLAIVRIMTPLEFTSNLQDIRKINDND